MPGMSGVGESVLEARPLGVVMPVYNEAGSTRQVAEAVLRHPLVRELAIVDDGSTDGSGAIIDRLAEEDPRIVVCRHAVNRGKGAALRTGFAAVSAPVVIVQDADFEYDPSDYARMVAPILDGRADVVFGSRFIGSEAHRVLFFWHSMGNRFLTLLANAVSNLNLTDMETGYKAFRREILDRIELREERFGIEPELTIKLARMGLRIYEVAVSYHGRTYAEGKKIGWRDGIVAVAAIFRHGFGSLGSQGK